MRRSVILGAGAALTALGTPPVSAQTVFPSRTLRMIVPYTPAGPTDLVGRLVASRLSDLWKQTVVVENRPGASGSTGSALALQAQPDGYTLVLGNNASHDAYELLNPKMTSYRTLRDFAPIALVGFTQTVMVISPTIPAKTLAEFVAYTKAHAGEVNYAIAAFGSAGHFCCELLNLKAGIDMTPVNYNGAAPALLAVAAGETQVYMGTISTVIGLAKEGRVRALAVMSDDHANELPELPTAAEAGFSGITWDSWFGVLASAKVPAEILDLENKAINTVMDGEAIRVQLESYGLRRKLGTRAEFSQMIQDEYTRTSAIIKQAKIRTN